jgi:hypothetical protein
MSLSITAKVTKCSVEKSWSTGPDGKPQNRHTIELEVPYVDDPEDANYKTAKSYQGTTLSLQTLDKKIADQYKVGQECTMILKKS